jgi:hypothetical protein
MDAAKIPLTRASFFIVCLIIGVVLVLVSAFVFVLPSLEPNVSTVNPNYSGLGILVNKTDIISSQLEIIVTAEPNTLYFQYFFICQANGTYNFLFSFPFNITREISSWPEKAQFNSTSSHGSAVWMHLDSNGTGGRSVSGEFEIADTFRSGSSGSNTFVLPFGFGVFGAEIFGNLTLQLNVTFAQGINTDLIFTVPSPKYDIVQTFPERTVGWLAMPGRPINWTNRAGGQWEFPEGLRESIIIYTQNRDEIHGSQFSVFFGGVVLSIGIQVAIVAMYDFSKERFGHRCDERKTSVARLYIPDNEIWARCPMCNKQNRVMKDVAEFHPTDNAPFEMECFNCHTPMTIGRCIHAPKTWKTPKA